MRRRIRGRKKLRLLREQLYPLTDPESGGSGSDSPALSKQARKRLIARQEDATCKLYMGNIAKVSHCWFTTCWFDNVPVEALVDTGAEASVIASRMFKQLSASCHSRTSPSLTQFRGIGGDQRSLGTAEFSYLIGDKKMHTNMHIVDLPHIDMILGMDAFLHENAIFHMSEGILKFPDSKPIRLIRRSQSSSTQVHTIGSIKLKANQARFISAAPIYGDDWLKDLGHCLVEPMDHVFTRTGLLAATAIMDNCSPVVRVYLMNTSDRDIEISKGMPIAKVSTVQKVSSRESPDFVEMHNLCFSHMNGTVYPEAEDKTSTSDDIHDIEQLTRKFLDTHNMCASKDTPSGVVSAGSTEEGPVNIHYTGAEQVLHGDECPSKPDAASQTIPQMELLHEHMRSVIQNIDLTGKELLAAIELLNNYEDVFVGPDGQLGRTTACTGHRIETGDTQPVRQRLRRVPPKRRQIIEDYVQQLLAQKCIKPSSSDWATPVVIVTKKDGTPRFCLDYRKLNAVTKKDAFPLPRIDDALDQLACKRYFCTFDLASGFYQLPMHPLDSHKTAFITHEGLYEWLVVPMGLSNSPATFQRCMAQVLKGLIPDSCLAYLDDIIVYGDDFEETLRNLRLVFDRLREANLKLKPKKCRIFQSQVAYLGHIVSQEGVRTDPKKIESIKNWPIPCDTKGVRSFLGLASYYRKFIPGFATSAHSLTRLTEKDVKFKWGPEESNSFEELKQALISSPILAYPNDKGMYIVDTDASNFGIGAVLSQVQNGQERVIAYASKSLSSSQRRYCTTKRELLAVVHFVGVTFRHYLLAESFLVRTDHSSLTWLTNFKDADGMLSRWLSILAVFNFTIEHRKGDKHLNADALSRKPPRRCPRVDCPNCYPDSDMQSCNTVAIIDRGRQLVRREVLATTPDDPVVATRDNDKLSIMAIQPIWDELDQYAWNIDLLRSQQNQDQDISAFKALLLKYPDERPGRKIISRESGDVKLYWTLWDDFCVENDILYRLADPKTRINRYVVPLRLRSRVLKYLHMNPMSGHFGVYRTINAAVRRFYWPRMRADIRRYVQCCMRCEMSKPGPGKGKMPLLQEISGTRNERVAMDLVVHYPVSKTGNTIILTIGDYFSKYFVAVALPNRRAETVARAFVENWICRLGGCPLTIHTDQGKELTGQIMSHLCEMMGIQSTRTLPYRPQSDGMVERFNSTLKQMLKTAVGTDEDRWDEYLPFCTMAYNATEQASTGCTPNMLSLCRELTMPVDVVFGSPNDKRPWIRADGSINYHVYVEWQRSVMVRSFAAARKSLKKAALRQERGYNVHLKARYYDPGNWVYKWYKPVADRKLGRGWRGPFVVTRVISDVVYEIQYHPKIKAQTVHVDHLKKCFAWQDHDNWVKNPNYKDPRNPTRVDPIMREPEMDLILSQEGEDDFDLEDLLHDKPPPLPTQTTPGAQPMVSPPKTTQGPHLVTSPKTTQGPHLVKSPRVASTNKTAVGGRPSGQALPRLPPADNVPVSTGVTPTTDNIVVAKPRVNKARVKAKPRATAVYPPPIVKTRCGRVVKRPHR